MPKAIFCHCRFAVNCFSESFSLKKYSVKKSLILSLCGGPFGKIIYISLEAPFIAQVKISVDIKRINP
jgi:hypothetical protein